MAAVWTKCYDQYKSFVFKNPELASEIETAFKWISYMVPSRSSKSFVLSELLYSASNLMVLVNDFILEQRVRAFQDLPSSLPQDDIRKYLAALGCLEVFAELMGAQVCGKVGRWVIIICIQVMKTAWKMVLIFKYKVGVVRSLSIPYLNRKDMARMLKQRYTSASKPHMAFGDVLAPSTDIEMLPVQKPPPPPPSEPADVPGPTFTLDSSGRVVRTIASAPPMSCRTWKIPPHNPPSSDRGEAVPPVANPLGRREQLAEVLYTLRPLAHLMCVGAFGEKSWNPWLLAVGIDMASLKMMEDSKDLSQMSRTEVRRRYVCLLFYLFRSPFYDKYSRQRIETLIQCIRVKIPFGSILWNAMLNFTDTWEKIYFYSWDP